MAQLDRASDYGSEGCRFESCRVYKIKGEATMSLLNKYGYKILLILFLCFFAGAVYSKFINAEPTVWCYECNRYVLESSKGHKTEPLED